MDGPTLSLSSVHFQHKATSFLIKGKATEHVDVTDFTK